MRNEAVLKAMKNTEAVWDIVEAKSEAFAALSDRIWDMPETNYEEYRSAEEHARQLEAEGFRVERGIAGLPTAVMGEAGEDGPVLPFSANSTPCLASARLPASRKSAKPPSMATATAAGTTCSAPAPCWRLPP